MFNCFIDAVNKCYNMLNIMVLSDVMKKIVLMSGDLIRGLDMYGSNTVLCDVPQS